MSKEPLNDDEFSKNLEKQYEELKNNPTIKEALEAPDDDDEDKSLFSDLEDSEETDDEDKSLFSDLEDSEETDDDEDESDSNGNAFVKKLRSFFLWLDEKTDAVTKKTVLATEKRFAKSKEKQKKYKAKHKNDKEADDGGALLFAALIYICFVIPCHIIVNSSIHSKASKAKRFFARFCAAFIPALFIALIFNPSQEYIWLSTVIISIELVLLWGGFPKLFSRFIASCSVLILLELIILIFASISNVKSDFASSAAVFSFIFCFAFFLIWNFFPKGKKQTHLANEVNAPNKTLQIASIVLLIPLAIFLGVQFQKPRVVTPASTAQEIPSEIAPEQETPSN